MERTPESRTLGMEPSNPCFNQSFDACLSLRTTDLGKGGRKLSRVEGEGVQKRENSRRSGGNMVRRLEGKVIVQICHKRSPEVLMGRIMEGPKEPVKECG